MSYIHLSKIFINDPINLVHFPGPLDLKEYQEENQQ